MEEVTGNMFGVVHLLITQLEATAARLESKVTMTGGEALTESRFKRSHVGNELIYFHERRKFHMIHTYTPCIAYLHNSKMSLGRTVLDSIPVDCILKNLRPGPYSGHER